MVEERSENSARQAMLIGCGYLGCRIARLLRERGIPVIGTTRSERRWTLFRSLGVETVLYDITGDLPPAFNSRTLQGDLDVFFMLPPSAISGALAAGGGFDRLVAAIKTWPVRRAILISSTSVYADDAAVVNAETRANPQDARGTRVLEIEQRWLGDDERFYVCRLAGLYGPDRVIGRRQLTQGEAIGGDPRRWLNLIHVEDAAELAVACAHAPNPGTIELGSDGNPVSRSTYYRFLAELLDCAAPRFTDRTARSRAGRRCDPSSTSTRLGWHPRYVDFRDGIRASLLAEQGA